MRRIKGCLTLLMTAAGLIGGLAAPVSAISLYSALTETLYMDCVMHVSGTGPAYRLDLQLTDASQRSAAGAKDTSPRQVFVATRFVEINESSLCDLGVDWGVDARFDIQGDRVTLDVPQVSVVDGRGQQVATADVGLVAMLNDLLFGIDRVEILSAPRIITGTDVRPEVVINEMLPYVSHGIGQSVVGTCLDVRPTVDVQGTIQMNLLVVTTQGPPSPATRIAETQVMIPGGDTVVLGGLTDIFQFDEYHQVPILAEIPFLNYLFRINQDQSTKTELVILVNAQVVDCRR